MYKKDGRPSRCGKINKKASTRRQSKEEEDREQEDSNDVQKTEGSHRADGFRKDQVLCHPSGSASRTIAEQHPGLDRSPQIVTVLPFGAYPRFIIVNSAVRNMFDLLGLHFAEIIQNTMYFR